MPKYRKKPVVVEAVQWWPGQKVEGVGLLPSRVRDEVERNALLDPDRLGWVETLEGGHIVSPGDYVITGIKGERYPCKPDIFEATYEPADDVPAANLLNAVYTERNRVVAGLARAVIAAGGLAGLATDPAEPDWPVVIIDLPGYGQVSWHVPEAEAEALFSFLGPYPGEWDGHTTEEKYDRLDAYAHERTSMVVWAAS